MELFKTKYLSNNAHFILLLESRIVDDIVVGNMLKLFLHFFFPVSLHNLKVMTVESVSILGKQ